MESGEDHTPLLAAAEQGHADTIAMLLTNRADLRAAGLNGDSALHLAVRQGHLPVARMLLERGIPVKQKTHGQTALEIAQRDENQDLMQLLHARGGKDFSQARTHRDQGWHSRNCGRLTGRCLLTLKRSTWILMTPKPVTTAAWLSSQKDSVDEAFIAFDAAMEFNPTFFDAYGAATRVHVQRHRWDKALALWDRLLARQPQNGLAHFERSIVRRAKRDTKGFMDDLQQACAFGHQAAY